MSSGIDLAVKCCKEIKELIEQSATNISNIATDTERNDTREEIKDLLLNTYSYSHYAQIRSDSYLIDNLAYLARKLHVNLDSDTISKIAKYGEIE